MSKRKKLKIEEVIEEVEFTGDTQPPQKTIAALYQFPLYNMYFGISLETSDSKEQDYPGVVWMDHYTVTAYGDTLCGQIEDESGDEAMRLGVCFIRFNMTKMPLGVDLGSITHECVHAVQAYCTHMGTTEADWGNGLLQQELQAYLATQLFRVVYDFIKENYKINYEHHEHVPAMRVIKPRLYKGL